MKTAFCILLCFTLLFTLSACEPPKKVAAWWGLFFPQMFAAPNGSEQVTFEWPLITRFLRLFG
ncbi:MAG: hypothetical protein IKW00_02615 [Clostridia bacterium]|nr:hypothetical protein [Clostridia bacterium]